MALNSSGPISLSGSVIGESIYKELETLYKPGGGNVTSSISLQDKWVTALAQKVAGTSVSTNDLYSKSKTMTNATLNKTSVSQTGTSSSTITVTTSPANAVTVTVSGGLFPYTYLWNRVSGNSAITAVSSTSLTTRFTASVTPCTQYTATFRCTVTDLSGATINSDTVDITLTNNGTAPGDPPCTL
jgi:hypothetical protein